MKSLPDLNNDSISVDSLVNRIKSKLNRIPMYPPNYFYKLSESETNNYNETLYGEYHNPFTVFSDSSGSIKLIRTSYASHSLNYRAYYYFDKDKLIYLYYHNDSYLIQSSVDKDGKLICPYDGNNYYFDNDKLIYWISEDKNSEEAISHQDSVKTIILDLNNPDNFATGNHLLENAYSYLNEAKSKIQPK